VYTARLEVDYRAPLPAESVVVCSAWVESFEGRKLWLAAELRAAPPEEDPNPGHAQGSGGVEQGAGCARQPGGSGRGAAAEAAEAAGAAAAGAEAPATAPAPVVFARSKSLFVIPRGDPGLEDNS
jgi:hypothetical protein